MTQSLNIQVPIRTYSEANLREHWAKRANRARKQRTDACYAIKASSWKPPVSGSLVVTLTRIGTHRMMDDDNLARSFKAVRDGVSDAIGIDDGSRRIAWRYSQRLGKDYAVTIDIQPAIGGVEAA